MGEKLAIAEICERRHALRIGVEKMQNFVQAIAGESWCEARPHV
ncbi:MAG TPA: hypothetical protein VFF81_09395 [Noviherbaspirillum sp.]|nr:hypothetical protein [Noviherbaspirillum sp.]